MARVGLPSKYAKMGFKKGWRAYKASKSKRRSNPKRKTTRKVKRVARKKRRRRKRTIPLAPVLGTVAGLMGRTSENPHNVITYIQHGNWEAAANVTLQNLTGYHYTTGRWEWRDAHALQGLLIGTLIHKAVNWLGGNRIFANLPSPLNKIRI